MAYFKIRNNTSNLGKRHPRFNTTQIIEHKDLLGTHQTVIAPNVEIIIESEYLPISAHKLRAEGYVTVQEIDKNTFQKLSAPAPQVVTEVTVEDAESKATKLKKKLN
jgi:hypothetical protein